MIEQATEADADVVIGLWQTCGLTRPWNDPQRDFRMAVNSPSSAVLLWRDEDLVAATVMVGFDGHRGWVYYLAVDPDRRRKGLGRQMMEATEAWLRARGAPKIQLMVREDNEEVIAFYEALGLTRQQVVTLGRFFDEPA